MWRGPSRGPALTGSQGSDCPAFLSGKTAERETGRTSEKDLALSKVKASPALLLSLMQIIQPGVRMFQKLSVACGLWFAERQPWSRNYSVIGSRWNSPPHLTMTVTICNPLLLWPLWSSQDLCPFKVPSLPPPEPLQRGAPQALTCHLLLFPWLFLLIPNTCSRGSVSSPRLWPSPAGVMTQICISSPHTSSELQTFEGSFLWTCPPGNAWPSGMM